MDTFLFDSVVFGPVKSRRLGISLGINLLPADKKICTFDCIYCECGWTDNPESTHLPTLEDLKRELKESSVQLKEKGITPDSITFAGNGEPTIHPEFAAIIDETIAFRNEHYPNAVITMLSNATMLHKKEVVEALLKIDQVMLKLDCGKDETFKLINRPKKNYSLNVIHSKIKTFPGEMIIQSLFVKGEFEGKVVDNTTDEEIAEWLERIKDIHPHKVIIYSIARNTPVKSLENVSEEKLEEIAQKVRDAGFLAEVY